MRVGLPIYAGVFDISNFVRLVIEHHLLEAQGNSLVKICQIVSLSPKLHCLSNEAEFQLSKSDIIEVPRNCLAKFAGLYPSGGNCIVYKHNSFQIVQI